MRKKLVQFFKDGAFAEQVWFSTDEQFDYEIVENAKGYGKEKGYDAMNVLCGDAYEL